MDSFNSRFIAEVITKNKSSHRQLQVPQLVSGILGRKKSIFKSKLKGIMNFFEFDDFKRERRFLAFVKRFQMK